MKLNTQPKTLEDYRDLTKVLKLKIVKQSKQIQQLQAKCKKYEDEMGNSMLTQRQQLNLTKPIDTINQDQHSTLPVKFQIMRKFLRSTSLFGITPESIYRIADCNYTNSIQSDYFRTILQKMALNLSPKQISTLIFIFDENCQGFISREDYYNSLYAYEIAMEGKSMGYMQECLLRFCALVYGDRVDVGGFYDEMRELARVRKGEVDLGIFEEQVKKYYVGRLQQRQIVGAFNQINLQRQKSLQKKNFLYSMSSFTNRLLLNDQRSRIQHTSPSQFIPPLSTINTNTKSQLKPSPITNPNTISTISINNNQKGNYSGFVNTNVINNINYNNSRGVICGQVSQIDEILKCKELKFYDLVLAMTQWDINSRLSIHQFKKLIKKLSVEQFTTEQISIIFKSLDINSQGSISVQDVINYSLKNYKDVYMIMMLIGKLLQVTSTTPEQFWNSQQFEDFNHDISKQKFIQVMSENCATVDPESWQFIWAYFDKGKGVISIQSVVDVWKKYYVQ